jgi:hypothetical protein
MALLKAVGDILKKLKKPKPKRVVDGKYSSPKDTSDMVAYPERSSLPYDNQYSKSLHRGKKQSEGFKESGHFDRRKSNDRRAETKSAKSNLASGATSALLMAPAAAVGAVAGIANEKRKKRKLNAKKKDVLGAASSVNEEKSIEGTFKKYKKSKLRKATAKDRKELADDSRARY